METKPITCHVELLLENGKIEKLISYLNECNVLPGRKIIIVDDNPEQPVQEPPYTT